MTNTIIGLDGKPIRSNSKDPLDAFVMMAHLAKLRGIEHIRARSGLTKIDVDTWWTVWVNPHEEKLTVQLGKGHKPFDLAREHALVLYNGNPVAVMTPTDGVFRAEGEASLKRFMQSLQAAIALETPGGVEGHA